MITLSDASKSALELLHLRFPFRSDAAIIENALNEFLDGIREKEENSEEGQRERLNERIFSTPLVQREVLGQKEEGLETIYYYVDVFGNDDLGYVASFDEYFSPNRKGGDEPEYYETRFTTTVHPSAAQALADALPSAQKEIITLIPTQAAPAPLLPSDFRITDGYIGRMGVIWQTATEETLAAAIAGAAQRSQKTTEEIIAALRDGHKVAWCDSPNHYYDHGTGWIMRLRKPARPVATVECDCGHSVPQSQVMSASHGSSCPDCYDRMSN